MTNLSSLAALSDSERAAMLSAIGLSAQDELFRDIPQKLRRETAMKLPDAMEEWELRQHMHERASANECDIDLDSYLGAGCYAHHVPSAVDAIAERGEFLTSYTPYQPEMSQGLLKALDQFARKVTALSGLPVVTSSHYDAATALADACWMAIRKTGRRCILIPAAMFPHYRRVLDTYAWARGIEWIEMATHPQSGATLLPEGRTGDDIAAVLVQSPNRLGVIEAAAAARRVADDSGALLVALLNPYLCAVGKSAAELGVDIAIFEGQPLGLHMFAGGAHIGILACSEELRHLAPGRLVGTVSDIKGHPALALVFEDREQHVARDRATSNICSNQALHAVRVGAFLTLYGGDGLKVIALRSTEGLAALVAGLIALDGVKCPYSGQTFNEAVVDFGDRDRRDRVLTACRAANILAGASDAVQPGLGESQLLIAVTETKSDAQLARFVQTVAKALDQSPKPVIAALRQETERDCRDFGAGLAEACGGGRGPFGPALDAMTEVELVRQYTNYSRENFGVDTGSYPLGSCTMKYNPKRNDAVTEVPGFRALHPFQPADTLTGLTAICDDLALYLAELLGMDAVDLTPAAGAHGEFRGLTVARRHFEDRGERQRTQVIVPDSAHGTNPASATMVGYTTTIVPTRPDGLLDISALKDALSDRTAVVMLTNPSTFGLFETEIEDIVALAHGVGALMYYDGANMNALMGYASPGQMGFDIAHINVHKTLSTPHGGGGPGAGPIGVKAPFACYLSPGFCSGAASDPLPVKLYGGHISVLLRAYSYIVSMGAAGLRQATADAVLNANYLAHMLRSVAPKVFPQLCMHEVLLDGSSLPCTTLDLSKRMIDFGIHPPTLVGAGCVYFGEYLSRAMLFEPTESESKENLDRMAAIISEIVCEAAATPDFVASAPHTTQVSRLAPTEKAG